MDQIMSRFWILLIAATCFTTACSDDVVGVDGGEGSCAENQVYNPISNSCQPKTNTNPNTPPPIDPSAPDASTPPDTSPNDPTDASPNNPPEQDTSPGQNTDTTPPEDTTPPQDTTPVESCGPGAIEGRACAPSGDILASATITLEGVDCDGNPFTKTATTNMNGDFDFTEVPAGEHTLTVRSGSFSNERSIFVNTGRVTDIRSGSEKVCVSAASAKIAVIKGSYDDMQSVLTSLALPFDIKGDDGGQFGFGAGLTNSRNFLTNAAAMATYDILFINCGELWARLPANDRTAIVNNLRTYVASGKSLYVSDRAHPFIQQAFPDMADFYGNDHVHSEAMRGYAPQEITANVISTEIQTLLGRNTATIQFPHNGTTVVNNHWVVVAKAGSDGVVHLQGNAKVYQSPTSSAQASTPVPDAPLMLTYKHPTGGTVIFTSFHNKAQATYNDDMKKIMRFMIFQL